MKNCFPRPPRIRRFRDGDFTFVTSSYLRQHLEYDYRHVYSELIKLDLDDSPPRMVPFNVWDTPPNCQWGKVVQLASPAHTEGSFKYSMKCMNYIRRYGWDGFTRAYQLGELPFI